MLSGLIPGAAGEAHDVTAKRRHVAGVILEIVHLDPPLQLRDDIILRHVRHDDVGKGIPPAQRTQVGRHRTHQIRVERQLGMHIASGDALVETNIEVTVQGARGAGEGDIRRQLSGEQAQRVHIPHQIADR